MNGQSPPETGKLSIPFQRREEKVVVTGSGPAGFFAAYVLSMAGFNVILLERGTRVEQRQSDLEDFEKGGQFNENSNYAFGEGGAGTFSDGKLTSRTKSISLEKQFIFDTYVSAGAPEEIKYLSRPHVGSDNLRLMMVNLRKRLEDCGVEIHFGVTVKDLKASGSTVRSVITDSGEMEADHFIFATGHSAYDTYRMLIRRGVKFNGKAFAVGVRVEHPQELINKAQWGVPAISGLKAAEYKLTWKQDASLPVYSFCMCPGGKVVPAAPQNDHCIVNGVSEYLRNSPRANSGIVAGMNLYEILGREPDPLESLDWVESIEVKAFESGSGFSIPGCRIRDFLNNKLSGNIPSSSYPFGVFAYDFTQLYPRKIITSLRLAMKNFTRKIKGFEDGVMLGTETKTSSPIQVQRDDKGLCAGFDNLYLAGEGSGRAGGIVSSAADGIKCAFSLINNSSI